MTTPVVIFAEAVATTVPAASVDAPVLSSKVHALESGSPPFSTLFRVSAARFVFVYVQLTLPPAGSVIVATLPLAEPPVPHTRLVKSQPVGFAPSVTE